MDQTFPCYFMLAVFILLTGCGAGETQCKHNCQNCNKCNHQQIRDTCYYIFKDKRRNWFNSRQFCADQGLSMVKITEDMIQQKQTYNFSGLFEDIPGGLFEPGESKTLAWLGGRAFDYFNWTFLNNIAVQSRVRVGSFDGVYVSCGFTQAFNNKLYLYYDKCAYLARFICRFYRTTGYNIHIIDTLKTWFEARSHCIRIGGDLFYLYKGETLSSFENDTRLTSITVPHHIGFTHRRWEWIDGSEIVFTDWYGLEPDTFDSKCLLFSSHNGQWYDGYCSEDRLAFCQADATTYSSLSSRAANNRWTEPTGSTTEPNYSNNQANNQAGVQIKMKHQLQQFEVLVIILGSLLGVFVILTISLTAFIVYKQWVRKSPKPSTSDASDYEIPETSNYVNDVVMETDRYEALAR